EHKLGEIGDDAGADKTLALRERAVLGDAFGEPAIVGLVAIDDFECLLGKLAGLRVLLLVGAFLQLVAEVCTEPQAGLDSEVLQCIRAAGQEAKRVDASGHCLAPSFRHSPPREHPANAPGVFPGVSAPFRDLWR